MSKLKAIKKIGKYSILLSIKESYLLSRNLYGLYKHPFKTLNHIFREKDYSQALLVFGIPFFTLIFGVLTIISLRFLINAPVQWGILAKFLLFLVFIFSFLIFIYLGFWIYKIFALNKRSWDENCQQNN